MPVHVLQNPHGGRGIRHGDAGSQLFANAIAGQDVVDLTRDSASGSSDALATAVQAGEIERLIVAGGDGLVHLAIQHLACTGIPMSIVPTGTGNDFAAAVSEIDGAVDPDEAASVDLLRVTSAGATVRWVASIVIAGFPAAINARANQINLPLGSFLYTAAALVELPRFSRTPIEYIIANESGSVNRTTDSAMLAVGNTRYFGGGMVACPDAVADDGFIHFTTIEGVGRVGVLRHLRQRHGGSADREEVWRGSGTLVELLTAGIDVWGDGEFIATSPLTIECVPSALRVKGVGR